MRLLFLLILPLFMLNACTEAELVSHAVKNVTPSTVKSVGYYKVGRPYTIAGKRYTPQETFDFTQTGVASWYGPNFHGKHTANGEIFDMHELTAAHKTLQLPSIVKVTNLENGRSVIVRVNDRGPFSKNRVIDLSKRSADVLGFIGQGTAKVRIDLLPDESRQLREIARNGGSTKGMENEMNKQYALNSKTPPRVVKSEVVAQEPIALSRQSTTSAPNNTSPNSIYVQAGAFSNEGAAVAHAQKLTSVAPNAGKATVYPASINGKTLYRVRLGPIVNRSMADSVIHRLNTAGHKNTIVMVE